MDVIAHYHSPMKAKFGIPRQSGIVEELQGEIVFMPKYRNPDFVRGLEGFDYIWLLWLFSANRSSGCAATVRPPLLGGNQSMGVFATRSPFRPNPIGLSSVRLLHVDLEDARGPVLHVGGADLMDGTPLIDIKPYVEYADSHPGVRSGFVDERKWQPLQVLFPPSLAQRLDPRDREVVQRLLALDPRPHYHDDPQRIYGMAFGSHDIRFQVADGILTVVDVCPVSS